MPISNTRPVNTILVVSLLGFGIASRTALYFWNRSLWLDEAMLALNVTHRTYAELLQPLDYNQRAPFGFLLLERLAVDVFGNSEWSLRFFPFFCGLVSLALFSRLALRVLPSAVALFALSLFVVSPTLIYYSAEAKQYSSDVIVALVLYTIAISELPQRLSWTRALVLAVVGLAALFLSHPAFFVLAGLGSLWAISAIHVRDWKGLALLASCGLVWFMLFGMLSYRELSRSPILIEYWEQRHGFIPVPPSSFTEARQLFETFLAVFENPLGFAFPGFAAFLFLAGTIDMFTRDRKLFFIILSPIPFVLLASALHMYPFSERLLLFMVPCLLIGIAEGINVFRTQLLVPSLCAVALAMLLAKPLATTKDFISGRYTVEEVRPALWHATTQWRSGDLIYVYHSTIPAFLYYANDFGFKPADYVLGGEDSGVLPDAGVVRSNSRVWVLLSHAKGARAVERTRIREYFNGIGREVIKSEYTDDWHPFGGVWLWLFDLTERNKLP